jgi:hypothetical protein
MFIVSRPRRGNKKNFASTSLFPIGDAMLAKVARSRRRLSL